METIDMMKYERLVRQRSSQHRMRRSGYRSRRSYASSLSGRGRSVLRAFKCATQLRVGYVGCDLGSQRSLATIHPMHAPAVAEIHRYAGDRTTCEQEHKG